MRSEEKKQHCWTDPLNIFEDQVEFPSPAKSFLQLHDVVLLQGPEHLQLPKRRLLDLLIFCERDWDDGIIPHFLSLPPTVPSLTLAVFKLLNGHQLIGLL